MWKLLKYEKVENGSLCIGKFVNQCEELFIGQSRYPPAIGVGRDIPRCLRQRNILRFMLSEMICNRMYGNPAHPAFERALEPVLIQPLEDSIEGLALDVLRCGFIIGVTTDNPEDHRRVHVVELPLGAALVFQTRSQQRIQPGG